MTASDLPAAWPLPIRAARACRSAWRYLRQQPYSTYDQNERLLLIDAAGAGVINAVAVFLPVFLVRLGASNLQVGAVSALPAFMAVILALPMGGFLARLPRVVPWLAWARLLVWLSYPLIGLLPFLLRQNLPVVILCLWALTTVPQVLNVVAVYIVLGGVADASRRYQLLSRRWAVAALSTAVAVVVIGQVLPWLTFPLGYQLVFFASSVATLVCFWAMSHVRLHEMDGSSRGQPPPKSLRQHGQVLLSNRSFLRFLAAQFVFSCGLQLTVPLLPLFWVRSLHASDSIISFINSIQLLAAVAAYFLWARAAQRHGQRWVLLACCLGLSLYPVLTAATANPWLLLPWAATAGLFGAGIDLTFGDALMSAGGPDEQPLFIGLYTTSANVAACAAPLAATLVAGWIGLGPALVGGTALRLIGFGLMVLFKVGLPKDAQPAI